MTRSLADCRCHPVITNIEGKKEAPQYEYQSGTQFGLVAAQASKARCHSALRDDVLLEALTQCLQSTMKSKSATRLFMFSEGTVMYTLMVIWMVRTALRLLSPRPLWSHMVVVLLDTGTSPNLPSIRLFLYRRSCRSLHSRA